MYYLKHLYYWLKAKQSGLKKLDGDARDYDLGIFGWFEYDKKHDRVEIPTVSIKSQYPLNNCVFQSTTVQKEIDEGIPLSVRSLTVLAKRYGLISGNGFSNLRSGQLMLQKHGILEQKVLSEGNLTWYIYSKARIDKDLASMHKTQSFWKVNNRSEIYKLLDSGKPLTMGMSWYTGFNQSGGFKTPWKIDKARGYYVGGHAVCIIGYEGDYLIIQNSYGKDWGDEGKFYIHIDYAEPFIKKWGAYANLDIPKNTAKFLNTYNGKSVRGNKSDAIYRIEGSRKRKYENLESFKKNAKPLSYAMVDQEELDLVKEGLSIK